MNTNPYAPPTAVVADVITDEGAGIEPPFFAVGVAKLVIMCLCTFLFYEVYWFYRNWRRIEDRERIGLTPWARALFAVFFCYPCFERIREYDHTQDETPSLLLLGAKPAEASVDVGWTLPAAPLAIGWTAFTLFGRFSNMLGQMTAGGDALAFLSFVAVGFLIPVQIRVNRLNAVVAPGHDRNSRIRGWNWLVVIPGALFVLLALTGLFLPE